MKKSRMLKVATLLLPLLLLSIWGFGQSIAVQGVTKDASGSPIPGVTVIERVQPKERLPTSTGVFRSKLPANRQFWCSLLLECKLKKLQWVKKQVWMW